MYLNATFNMVDLVIKMRMPVLLSPIVYQCNLLYQVFERVLHCPIIFCIVAQKSQRNPKHMNNAACLR